MLHPIATIKYNSSEWLHIFGGGGQLSFQGSRTTQFDITTFVTEAAREFHIGVQDFDSCGYSLVQLSRRLPALEALVLSGARLPSGLLSALAKEPILCPSLKTIAFFDCKLTELVIKELEEVVTKRGASVAVRLYRVVILNNTRSLPDLKLIHQLRKFVPRVDVGVGDELPNLL